MDVLAGKTDSEIRRAAVWWFTAQEAYCRGERVPLSVFLLSVRDLTDADIKDAHEFASHYGLLSTTTNQIE